MTEDVEVIFFVLLTSCVVLGLCLLVRNRDFTNVLGIYYVRI